MRANLRSLVDDLTPKEVKRGLRNAVRKEMRTVRRAAVSAFKGGKTAKGRKIAHAASIAKGIRAKMFRDGGGFLVTSTFRGRQGYYKNSKGLLKPLPLWYDMGVTRPGKAHRGLDRGDIPAIGAVAQAERKELPNSLRRISAEFERQAVIQFEKHHL